MRLPLAKILPQTSGFKYHADSLHWTFPGDSVTILRLATEK